MVLNSVTHIIKNFCLCNLTLLLYELCYLIECDWAWLEQLCLRVISYVWNIYWFGRSNDNYKVWVFIVCLCMWVCIRRTCLHYTWTTQRTTTSTLSSTVLHVPHCVILLIRTWTRLTTDCWSDYVNIWFCFLNVLDVRHEVKCFCSFLCCEIGTYLFFIF